MVRKNLLVRAALLLQRQQHEDADWVPSRATAGSTEGALACKQCPGWNRAQECPLASFSVLAWTITSRSIRTYLAYSSYFDEAGSPYRETGVSAGSFGVTLECHDR